MFSPLFARLLRLSVFALLLASTVVAMVASERVAHLWRPSEMPGWVPLAVPLCFILLLVVFALDRVVAVRRGQELLPRAVMQVGAAVFLVSLLLPQEVLELRRAWRLRRASAIARNSETNAPDAMPTDILLQHEDARVREATCLLLAWPAWVPPSLDEAELSEGEASSLAGPSDAVVLLDLYREVSRVSEDDPVEEVRTACRGALARLQDDLEAGRCNDEQPGPRWRRSPTEPDGHNGEPGEEERQEDVTDYL